MTYPGASQYPGASTFPSGGRYVVEPFTGALELPWTTVRGAVPLSVHMGTGVINSATNGNARCDVDLGSDDVYAEITVAADDATTDRSTFVMTRCQPSYGSLTTYTYYALYTNRFVSGGTWSLVKYVNGVPTGVSGAGPTPITLPSTPYQLRLESQGNTHRCYIAGSLVGTFVDADIPTGRYAGVGFFNGALAARLDLFQAGQLVAAPTPQAGTDSYSLVVEDAALATSEALAGTDSATLTDSATVAVFADGLDTGAGPDDGSLLAAVDGTDASAFADDAVAAEAPILGSARFSAAGNVLYDDIVTGGTYTVTFWGRLAVDRNDFSTFTATLNPNFSAYDVLQTAADGTTLTFNSSGGVVNGPALAVGTWYKIALVKNGTTATLYVGTGAGSLTTYSGAASNTGGSRFLIGAVDAAGGEFLNGNVAAFKKWDAALTASEVAAELAQYNAARVTSLRRVHAFKGDALDSSGNGNQLTSGGAAVAYETGPGIPDVANTTTEQTGSDTVAATEVASVVVFVDDVDTTSVGDLGVLNAAHADTDAVAGTDTAAPAAASLAGVDTVAGLDGDGTLALDGLDVVELVELGEPAAVLGDGDAWALADADGALSTADQLSGTDTWTATDGGDLTAAVVDTDPATEATGESLAAAAADVDTVTGLDVAALDTADQYIGTDALTLTDAGALAAALVDTETGAQGDSTSTAVALADTDAVTSGDAEELSTANQAAGSDTFSAVELADVEVTVSDVDTVAAVDSSDLLAAAVPVAGVDTVTGTDAGAVSAAAAGVDTGGYGETAEPAAALSGLDAVAGGELEALDVAAAGTEAGTLSGETGGVVIGTELFSVSDVAALAESAALVVLLDVLDDTAVEELADLAAAAAGSDGSALVDTGAVFDQATAAKLPLRAAGAPTLDRSVTAGTVTADRPVRAGRPVRDSPW